MNIKRNVIVRAIKEAKVSTVCRGKVGAVIFSDSGHIICSSFNTTVYGYEGIWTIHAEEWCLAKAHKIKARERFGNLNMLVVRYKISIDKLAMAKPCEKCSFLIKEAGIQVYYSDENGKIEEFSNKTKSANSRMFKKVK